VVSVCGACVAFGASEERSPPALDDAGPGPAPADASGLDGTPPPSAGDPFACTGGQNELACMRFEPEDWPGGWTTYLDGSLTDPLAVTFELHPSPGGKLGVSGRAYSATPQDKMFHAYARTGLDARVTGSVRLQLEAFLEEVGPQGTVLAQVSFAGTDRGLHVRVSARSGQISVQEFAWEGGGVQLGQHLAGAPTVLKRWTRIALAVTGDVSAVSLAVDGNTVVEDSLKVRPSGDLDVVTELAAGLVLSGLEENAGPSTVYVDDVRLTMGE
jgi:hypothetical protein